MPFILSFALTVVLKFVIREELILYYLLSLDRNAQAIRVLTMIP